MKVNRDSLGIPIVTAAEIEQIAEYFLRKMAPSVLSSPQFTPLAEIATTLVARNLCKFSLYVDDLGADSDGRKILGYYSQAETRIAIDRSLIDDDPRFAFTLAHELGHFFLHGKLKPAALDLYHGTVQDTSRSLVSYRVQGANARSLIEWQANCFAACILLPRKTVVDALEAAQRSRGQTRNLRRIWLDWQPQSQRDYRAIMLILSGIYKVPQSVVRIRLAEMRLIQEAENYMPRHIAESFGDALRKLFAAAQS